MEKFCIDVKPLESELAISNIEKKYNIPFSDDFIHFFLENNGGIPKKNIIMINETEYEIRCFLSFNDNEYNSIAAPLASFWEETHGKVIPIAKDSSDCYYCINIQNGKIYFWNKYDNLYYCISESFLDFLNYLK